MSKYNIFRSNCVSFDLSIILIDGPIKQYYLCILRGRVITMSYDLRPSNLEADVEI